MKGYELGHAACDASSRRKKAAMIAAVLRRAAELPGTTLLNIGTGTGVICSELASRGYSVTSVDVADSRTERAGYDFALVEDERLPFPSESYDIVLSNHVIEHVQDQHRHLTEAARVLKPGGVIYLATPNRWWPIEPHYRLPLLSWLPQQAADWYLRLTLRRRWDVKLLSARGLETLAAEVGLTVHDESARILRFPAEYSLNLPQAITSATRRIPLRMFNRIARFLPTQVRTLRRVEVENGAPV